MISKEAVAKEMANARRQAEEVIRFRDRELSRRAEAIAKAPRSPRVGALEAAAEALGPPPRGVLIAEGDSWFDYPFYDVLRILEDHHGYEVESVAHKGDRIEEMAYAAGQLEEFTRLLEKLLRRGTVAHAILLSGGGNDIAGKEFGMLLNHAASAIAGLNDSIVAGAIDQRVKMAFVTIISEITEVCRQRIGAPLPIILHGYDYPVPDGRGFLGGWWLLPGPWLEPGFREKGFSEMQDRIDLAKELMDRFNAMLKDLVSFPEFGHVHFIDLRGTLSVDAGYRDDWANELHPTGEGFEKVTALFAETIEDLP